MIRHSALAALCIALFLSDSRASQEFGTITFPTSATGAAQDAFLIGVKALHNFQFDEAAEAFQQSQKADNTVCHGLLGRGDEPQPSAVGAAGSRGGEESARSARRHRPPVESSKAKLPKEKALLRGAHQSVLRRRATSSRATRRTRTRWRGCTAQWPDDHEIAMFYALSLLGTRDGPATPDSAARRSPRRSPQAVFQKNPKHPGAAHFVIHAFDDPDHAPLGLTAARAYAKIAPSAAHALAYAVAHLRSARHVAGRRAVRTSVAQGRRRPQHAHEAAPKAAKTSTRSRGSPTPTHARQVRRREEEHRTREAGGGSQSAEPRRARRLPGHARAATFPTPRSGRSFRSRPRRRQRQAATTPNMPGMPRHGGLRRLRDLGLHRRRQRRENWATWRRPRRPRRH